MLAIAASGGLDFQLRSIEKLLSGWLSGSSGIYLESVDTELGIEEGYMFNVQRIQVRLPGGDSPEAALSLSVGTNPLPWVIGTHDIQCQNWDILCLYSSGLSAPSNSVRKGGGGGGGRDRAPGGHQRPGGRGQGLRGQGPRGQQWPGGRGQEGPIGAAKARRQVTRPQGPALKGCHLGRICPF